MTRRHACLRSSSRSGRNGLATSSGGPRHAALDPLCRARHRDPREYEVKAREGRRRARRRTRSVGSTRRPSSRAPRQELRAAADDAAKTMSGWAPRGRSCCGRRPRLRAARTLATSCAARSRRLMPLVCGSPQANSGRLAAGGAPFFVIKYTAQSRPNFGLHTDGSAVVNVALSDERKNDSVADDEFVAAAPTSRRVGRARVRGCSRSRRRRRDPARWEDGARGLARHRRRTLRARRLLLRQRGSPSPGLFGLKSAGVHLTGWLQGMRDLDALPKSAAAPLPLRFPDDVSGSGRNGAKHRDGCSLLNCFERSSSPDDDADRHPRRQDRDRRGRRQADPIMNVEVEEADSPECSVCDVSFEINVSKQKAVHMRGRHTLPTRRRRRAPSPRSAPAPLARARRGGGRGSPRAAPRTSRAPWRGAAATTP